MTTGLATKLAHQALRDAVRARDAREYLDAEPPPVDPVLQDTLDKGDKLMLVAASKMRKSLFILMLAICLAAGRDFLNWKVPKPRTVLYAQWEIREHHVWRRVRRLCKAMGIKSEDLGGRLRVMSLRGKEGWAGVNGVEGVQEEALAIQADVVITDPFYKLLEGEESKPEGVRPTLQAFDGMSEVTGAAVIFPHHDRKGDQGATALVDRGSGSGVLGRDYDAAIYLTPHSNGENEVTVVEAVVRNYAPQAPFTVEWTYTEDGYRFEVADDITPSKKTKSTRTPPPDLDKYLPTARSILADHAQQTGQQEMVWGVFKAAFKDRTKLSEMRTREFLALMTADPNPPLRTSDERQGRGKGRLKLVWASFSARQRQPGE